MKDLKGKVELVVNVIIAVSVVTIAGITIKRYLSQGQSNTPSAQAQIGVGSKINVPGVDWQSNKRTMIFFLKTDCKYCTSSAPFFRELISEAQQRNVSLLAILPHQVQEAKDYLKQLNLVIDNVQTGSLASYRVPGTPTVVLVDDTGRVIRAWIGAIEPEKHEAVKGEFISSAEVDAAGSNVKAQQSQTSNVRTEVDPRELKQMLETKEKVVVVDVDQRTDFDKEHIPNSINIPADEISVRAVHEISKESRIILYCRCKDSSATVEVQAQLRDQGFPQVSVLKGGFASWKENGLPISSSK